MSRRGFSLASVLISLAAQADSPLTDVAMGGEHWAYFDSKGHAYNLFWNAGNFGIEDATALSGAPPAAPGSSLTSFADPQYLLFGRHWAYFDNNGHAYNIFWTPMDGYGMDDATARSGAPPAAPGSPLAGFAHSWFLLEHWAYFGNNGHAYDIMWTRAGGYAVDDATARSGAPPAAPGSSLAGFVDPDGPPQ